MSDDDIERSASGSPILRLAPIDRPFTPASAHDGSVEVERKLSALLGEATNVFHEIVSDLVHIDINVVPPTPEREFWTLFTTGMSDLAMTVPEGAEEMTRAELVLRLPSSWRVNDLQITPPPPELEQWYWPIGWMKWLARYPHEYGTWLGFGHTIPNGDPPAPLATGTRLCGWLLLPPLAPMDPSITLDDGTAIHVYVMHGLHPEELQLKVDKGVDKLLSAFDKAGVREILDPRRPTSVEKSHGRGFFRRA